LKKYRARKKNQCWRKVKSDAGMGKYALLHIFHRLITEYPVFRLNSISAILGFL
jgi:hypothetical protein